MKFRIWKTLVRTTSVAKLAAAARPGPRVSPTGVKTGSEAEEKGR